MQTESVLISGAGIAGPTLAYWLNRAGFRPTLVEHAPALRDGGYVIDFWGLGFDIAKRMGLAAELDRIGYHVKEMCIVDDRGGRIAGFGTGVFRALAGGRYVTLRRTDLSRLLFAAAEPTTEVIFDDEITSLNEHEDHVEVAFRRARPRRFDLVVGADGLHSGVRRLVFGPDPRFERRLGYRVAAFEAAGYRPRDEDIYIMHNTPGRMLGRFALHDDRTLFLFVWIDETNLPAGVDLATRKAHLRAVYQSDCGETRAVLEALAHTSDLYFESVSQIRIKPWSRGRVALLGDAAFCVSLLAGQGSALAMTAAYVLAGELAAAPGRHAHAYASYENLLRDFVARKQRAAEAFGSSFAPRTAWGLFLRNQIIKAFALPGLARLAIGRDISDRLRLPEYRWQQDPRSRR